MRAFLTGATGYIGGSVAAALIAAGHQVDGLVRSEDAAGKATARGITPVPGDLDDAEVLKAAARRADVVIHTAHADHEASAHALLDGLAGSGKLFLHTSGSSIVGTQAGGNLVEDVFDEDTPFTPSPGRAARAALNDDILAAASQGIASVVIAPALIYGPGRGAGAHSMQVPWLLETAKRHGVPKHFGPGSNRWSNVYIDDLVDLYMRILMAPTRGTFYFAEAGEQSMQELCAAIGTMLFDDPRTEAMTLAEAAAEWGEGPAMNTMGSNSRVRAVRARAQLGWSPGGPSAIDEICSGVYAG